MPSPDPAYCEARDADLAWSAALRKEFGSRAGDMRYTPRGAGEPGSELRRLHDTFREKMEAWRARMLQAANENLGVK